MKVLALDPVSTHARNPECSMRLVPTPDCKNWICVDCGVYILQVYIEVFTVPETESHAREVKKHPNDNRQKR